MIRVVAWRCVAALGLATWLGTALANPDAAQALRAQRAAFSEQLQHNVYARPLVLLSSETPPNLRGDIYALMAFPFATVSSALQDPQQWCEVMVLHLNTKYCHTASGTKGTVLNVNIGKKVPETLSQAARIALNFTVAATQPDYFEVRLQAKDGPMGTSNYQLALEAVAQPSNQTFLHLTYSYSANLAGRLAMQAYLATLGRDKVGFTQIGESVNGHPAWIGGMRALAERNTMRYYLAIDSYLASAALPPAERFERSLQSWFKATEQYPRQLHEIEWPAYLAMKRAEHLRQQTAQ
ncbi:hypothetical protein [Rhodoferax sp.]|uniref:hypothetical protein n=1 Tax=Rhodoferax sp. TaxID=50421 RepID=UPI00284F9F01|nr:hypothetical protein [Rhodoferax sp.]MDR3369003.1 hypothetical protein [Rhodoferax sp.]